MYFNLKRTIYVLYYFFFLSQPEQWIDDALENEVSQVLEVCAEIRQMKKVQNILKKHGPRSE